METENKQNIQIFIYTENIYKGTQYIYKVNDDFIAVADKIYNNFDSFVNDLENKKDYKKEISLLTTEDYKTALNNIKNISNKELYNFNCGKDWIDDNIVNHVVTHKKQPNTLYNYYHQDTNRIYNIFVYNDIYARTLRKIDNSRKLNNLLDIGVNFNEDDLYNARKHKKRVRLKYFKDIDRLDTKTINNILYLNLIL